MFASEHTFFAWKNRLLHRVKMAKVGSWKTYLLVALTAMMFPYTPLFSRLWRLAVDDGVCLVPESQVKLSMENGAMGECYFRDNYFDARDQFVAKAQKANAEMRSVVITKHKDGRDLTMDVAIFRGNASSVLLHVSGTHGPEGFAGSAVQAAILDHLMENPLNKDGPTIVLVHALNPFGFANNRRVNEDNVDLNRNFLTDEEFKDALARDPNVGNYATHNDILNPERLPSEIPLINDLWAIGRTLLAVVSHGVPELKVSFVCGNYRKSDGIGFGGFTRTKSVNEIKRLADELGLSKAKRFVMLDVHTGLGPEGVDTLVLEDRKLAHIAAKYFPEESTGRGGLKDYNRGGEAALSGYDFTIGTSSNLCAHWIAPHLREEDGNLMCLTQEFGTVPTILVGFNSILENVAYFHGSDRMKDFYGKRYRSAFYVEKRTWKQNVVRRGVTTFLQGINFLNDSQ